MMEFFLSGSLPLIDFVICDVMSDMVNKLLSLISRPRGHEFDSRQLRYQVTRSTQPSIPPG